MTKPTNPTPETRTVVYVGHTSPTIPSPHGISHVAQFGDELVVDSTWEHYEMIDRPDEQESRWGAVAFLAANDDDPNVLEVRALVSKRAAERRAADHVERLQAAHTAEQRALVRLRDRDAAVAAAQAEHAATTSGGTR